MEEWGEERDLLVNLFGKFRDEWMDQDLNTWIGATRYPIRIFCKVIVYIYVFDVSLLEIAWSKSEAKKIAFVSVGRFADALVLRELAGVTIPPERIFGLGSDPKVEVLKMLQKKPEHQGLKLPFVEDRLATLKNVIKEPELDGWSLYLGTLLSTLWDWGYNTEEERDEAARISRIQILQLSDLSTKLK
ncbi:hypothetical protein RchiOBHm_Chr1g0356441 [Rosa chinensis]|uniref:Uncharacterized protein n=1 Tax=Rosa chinensis TaxID=74649 RepID=A0A2P6SHN3_ROSCH|nr:hypothetical protein RchiOBHm_Chr1g0356441 [Rosa chinensis]